MLEKSKSLSFLKEGIQKNISFLVDRFPQETFPIFLTSFFQRDILIISQGSMEDALFKNLSSHFENVIEFPSWDTFPQDNIQPCFDTLGKRFESLKKISKKEKKIILSPLQSILQKTIAKEDVEKYFYPIKKTQTLSFEHLIKILEDLGYTRVSLVQDKGEYAVRGGIIDLFCTSEKTPHRIEFLENTIESIRLFDIGSQKTIKKIESFMITPSKEIEYTKKKYSFLLDYLNNPIIIFNQIEAIENSYVNIKNSLLKKYFLSLEEFLEKIKKFSKIYTSKYPIEKISKTSFEKENICFELFQKKFQAAVWKHPFTPLQDYTFEKDFKKQLQELIKQDIKTYIFSEKNDLFTHFKKENITYKKGFLFENFVIFDIPLALISYPLKQSLRRQEWRASYQSPNLGTYEIKPGDIVVHFHMGIGKYLNIEKKKNHLGNIEEFLVIEYKNNNKLYVPISQSYLVSKYIGSKEETPSFNSFGSKKWQMTKNQAQKNIVGYAKDLLELYAKRSQKKGTGYGKDSEEMILFEESFPYE